MASIGHAFGISFKPHGAGKFRVRWRQFEEQPYGTVKKKLRSMIAYSMDEVKRLALDIEDALGTDGWYEPGPPAMRPVDLNMEQVAVEWLRWKHGTKKVAPNTWKNLARAMKRWFGAVRMVNSMKPGEVVPARLMTQAQLRKVQSHWRNRGRYGDESDQGLMEQLANDSASPPLLRGAAALGLLRSSPSRGIAAVQDERGLVLVGVGVGGASRGDGVHSNALRQTARHLDLYEDVWGALISTSQAALSACRTFLGSSPTPMLAANGVRKQPDLVDMGCLEPPAYGEPASLKPSWGASL
ncbi:MAG: hypothetical protein ACI9MC_003528 [Kiritimatiellia bacterium]|jgi:hypothetical protein